MKLSGVSIFRDRRESLKLNVILVIESKALYFWRKRYPFPSVPSIDKWCLFTYLL